MGFPQSLEINMSNLAIVASDQCRPREIPADYFGPMMSEKANHGGSNGGDGKRNESS